MINDALGTRMKTNYENIPKTKLVRRMPVIIRIDGKAFHTYTRGFNKPFDDVLIKSMQDTTAYLCASIQGCVLGYCQSDEISLLLIDYKRLTSSAWFDYEVQKLCSISAAMATLAFNRFFEQNVIDYAKMNPEASQLTKYNAAMARGAMFDSRCFNIPKEEVNNYFIWRQLDAMRNSIQMVGQANFSHKELMGKSCNEIQNMLMTQKNINWNNFAPQHKRGSVIIRTAMEDMGVIGRPKWVAAAYTPDFKKDHNFVDDLLEPEEI